METMLLVQMKTITTACSQVGGDAGPSHPPAADWRAAFFLPQAFCSVDSTHTAETHTGTHDTWQCEILNSLEQEVFYASRCTLIFTVHSLPLLLRWYICFYISLLFSFFFYWICCLTVWTCLWCGLGLLMAIFYYQCNIRMDTRESTPAADKSLGSTAASDVCTSCLFLDVTESSRINKWFTAYF